jgi:hypothetical protein
MNSTLPSLIAAKVTIVITLALMMGQSAHAKQTLTEDAALNFLLRTLERDHVYEKRISLDCVAFDTEEKSGAYFQFALRENHTAKCGGDPDVSPVVDRYRVYRASRKIERLNMVDDKWQPYDKKCSVPH